MQAKKQHRGQKKDEKCFIYLISGGPESKIFLMGNFKKKQKITCPNV